MECEPLGSPVRADPKVRTTSSDLRLVQDRLDVLLLLRTAKALDLKGRLFFQDVLRVQLGHFLVMPGFFRRPVLASGQLLVARVLRDAELVEVGLRAGAN